MLIDETVPFGSREYFIFLALLLFARGMDFFSTWVATPHMVLEGNPIAKRLGWKWGGLLNLGMCVGFGCAPLPAVIISTTSLLVAARNFQGAWLMRNMGEHSYRAWMTDRLNEGRMDLFILCLLAQCLLTAAIGGALLWLGGGLLIPVGVGIGVIAYAAAVFIYSLLGVWHRRHRG
jgi:hypothetical protein